jgi:hypothetical protein
MMKFASCTISLKGVETSRFLTKELYASVVNALVLAHSAGT